MSIQAEINRIKAAVQAAYTAVSGKGGTVPASKTSANLAAAINSIPAGTDTSDATATAGNILSGKTAYVKGSKVTGTIASQAAQTITPGTSDKTIASGRYLSGTQTIQGDANLTAENIKSGVSIFGVEGSYAGSGATGPEKYAVAITDTRTAKGMVMASYQNTDGTLNTARLAFSGNTANPSVPKGFFGLMLTTAWSNITAASGVSVLAKDDTKKTIIFGVTGAGTITIS